MDTCCLFAVVNICLLIRSDRFAKRQAITNLFIIKSIYYGSEFKQRKDCGIPGTVICPHSAKSVGDVISWRRPGKIGRHGVLGFVLGSVFQGREGFLNKRYYVCKRGEFVGQCEELAKRCGMCTKTLNRSLVWLQEKDLIGLKRLNGGIRVCVCGYDSIMGIRRKEAGKDAPEQSAFLSLEEAERRMGGRSMQFDCCTADGEGGLQ